MDEHNNSRQPSIVIESLFLQARTVSRYRANHHWQMKRSFTWELSCVVGRGYAVRCGCGPPQYQQPITFVSYCVNRAFMILVNCSDETVNHFVYLYMYPSLRIQPSITLVLFKQKIASLWNDSMNDELQAYHVQLLLYVSTPSVPRRDVFRTAVHTTYQYAPVKTKKSAFVCQFYMALIVESPLPPSFLPPLPFLLWCSSKHLSSTIVIYSI